MLEKQFSEIDIVTAIVVVRQEEETSKPPPAPVPMVEETLPIGRLLKRLKRSWFLQKLPGSLGGTEPLSWRSVRYLEEVLANFSDVRWRERTVAAWALGQSRIPPALEEEVAEALKEVLDNRDSRLLVPSRSWRWLKRTYGMTLISVIACLMAFWLGDAFERFSLFEAGMVGSFLLAGIGSVIAAPIVLPLGFWVDAQLADTVRIAAANSLGRLRKPESVGVLAKALFDRNRKVREAAESAFRAVLPTLTPEHYGHLGADTIPHLCRALHYEETQLLGFPADQERLIFRILEALGKVGDGNAVKPVAEIAEYGLTTRIREQAKRILPILQARQRRENEPRMLLRATTTPADIPSQLLRPALATALYLQAHFSTLFPNGLTIGIADGAGPKYDATWTNVSNLQTWLRGAGTAGALTADTLNATSTSGGKLARQTATLTILIALSGGMPGDPPNFGLLVYHNAGDYFDGMAVTQILGEVNKVLSGDPVPTGYTYDTLNDLVEAINNSFLGGVPSAWAQAHLTP